jgi:hypothetical protein
MVVSGNPRDEARRMSQASEFRQTGVSQEVYEEGVRQATESITRWLVELGYPIAVIARATRQTPAQIRTLIKKPVAARLSTRSTDSDGVRQESDRARKSKRKRRRVR